MLNNIPYIECYVRDAFLYNDFANKELSKCYIFAVKTLINRPLLFQIQIDNGAIFQGLPIHAFVHRKDFVKPIEDEHKLLSLLQWWNMQSNDATVIKYTYLDGYAVDYYNRDKVWTRGKYLFTIDDYYPNVNNLQVGYAEDPDSKSFNIIELENGFYAAAPNNYLRFHNLNFVEPFDLKNPPKYKPNSIKWDCEMIQNDTRI